MKESLSRKDNSKRLLADNLPRQRTFFQRFIGFFTQFRRFGWDIIGILLILFAVVSLLGVINISRGLLITPWIEFLTRRLGWGSSLGILMVGLAGVASLGYSAGKRFPLTLGQVLSIEGAYFCLLALLSIIGGFSLNRAEAGKDGGVIGWGLARIIPGFLGVIVYGLLFIILLGLATGLFHKLLKKVASWGDLEETDGREDRSNVVHQRIRQDPHESVHKEIVGLIKETSRDVQLPPLNLLMREHNIAPDQSQIRAKAQIIENTFAEFSLPVKVIGFRVGPSVTQFAVEPGYIIKVGSDGRTLKQKVRVSQISGLSRDLTRALSASRLRIETPVPGRSFVGIEVPNSDNYVVRLRPVIESSEFSSLSAPLALGLGRNVSGEVVVADLEKMPHLLIAGTTNSGKSVCITAITTCLVMNNSPRDLKLVMLDPKMVELVRFNGLPHLLGKVETDPYRMQVVLRWALAEMDARYRLLADAKARNIETYNHKMIQKKQPTMPRIVILIDELADLMMSAPDQTEHSLVRLAQMARATGMHLVVATQRPSADVITGLIKANFPARISFAVATSIDSRVVLDTNGAETLLGRGDMLYLDPARSGLQRVQGVWVGDTEIEKVVNHWQRISESEGLGDAPWETMTEEAEIEGTDELLEQAVRVVKGAGKASVSLVQRRLHVGFPRAAHLMDEMEKIGVVGPSKGSGKDREVLFSSEDDVTNLEDD